MSIRMAAAPLSSQDKASPSGCSKSRCCGCLLRAELASPPHAGAGSLWGKFFPAATPVPAQGQVPSGGGGLWFGTTGFVFQNRIRAAARGRFGAADAPDTALRASSLPEHGG